MSRPWFTFIIFLGICLISKQIYPEEWTLLIMETELTPTEPFKAIQPFPHRRIVEHYLQSQRILEGLERGIKGEECEI